MHIKWTGSSSFLLVKLKTGQTQFFNSFQLLSECHCWWTYILTPPNPQGHGMSVKSEEPIDKRKSKFGYCIITQTLQILHFVCKWNWITDRQTNKQTVGWKTGQTDKPTNDPITRCCRWTFQTTGIKISKFWLVTTHSCHLYLSHIRCSKLYFSS